MKKLENIAYLFPVLVSLLTAYPVRAEKISIVYLTEGIAEFKKTEKMAALQVWGEEIASQNQLEAEARIIGTLEELMREVQAKRVHFALMSTAQYLMRYQEIKSYVAPEMYAVTRTDELYEDYIIVSKANSPVKSLADLKHKHVSLVKDYLLVKQYLKYLTLKTNKQDPEQFFKKVHETPTSFQALLDVYFKRSDACLVPRIAYMMAGELNPEIFEQLSVIHNSKKMFIPAVVLTFNSTQSETRAILAQYFLEAQFSVHGQQILDLFKVKHFIQIDEKQLQPMLELYE